MWVVEALEHDPQASRLSPVPFDDKIPLESRKTRCCWVHGSHPLKKRKGGDQYIARGSAGGTGARWRIATRYGIQRTRRRGERQQALCRQARTAATRYGQSMDGVTSQWSPGSRQQGGEAGNSGKGRREIDRRCVGRMAFVCLSARWDHAGSSGGGQRCCDAAVGESMVSVAQRRAVDVDEISEAIAGPKWRHVDGCHPNRVVYFGAYRQQPRLRRMACSSRKAAAEGGRGLPRIGRSVGGNAAA